ncbi:MAG: cellulase family glycosylhydrolase [Kiritimatiellia bacterium]
MNPLLRAIPSLLLLVFAASGCGRAAKPFLKANGNDLRNDRGKGAVVLLRGVNLGGWLLHEPWMSPMDKSGLLDDHSSREILDRRFGREVRDSLIAAYQDAYITTWDLDLIAAAGFNVIRLPFWYRTLQEEDGTWRPDAFARMDWLVDNAWARGIYTVLDLHGAPGGQSDGEATGRVRRKDKTGLVPDFWDNEAQLRRTVGIWERVAAHYKGNPAVAAYDLINEPMGAPGREKIWEAYHRLYTAVRAVDPDHVISVEVCWSGRVEGRDIGWCWEILPRPEHFGWANMLYQLHNYEWDWNNLDKQIRSTDHMVNEWESHRAWGVPCFIGEFNCMARPEAWNHTLKVYSDHGMSWALWNYKATHGTGSDSWGYLNPRKPMPPKPDLQHDSVAEIRRKWSAFSSRESFEVNPMLRAAWEACRLPAKAP